MTNHDSYLDLKGNQDKLRERVSTLLMRLDPEEITQKKILEAIEIGQLPWRNFIDRGKRVEMKTAKKILAWIEKKEKELK